MLFISCLILFWAPWASAQLNESDTVQLQLRASLTGMRQAGNVDFFSLSSSLVASTHLGPFAFKSQNSVRYQAFAGNATDNDLDTRNFLYYNCRKTVYPYLYGIASSNFRRQISMRYLFGAGMTAQILQKPEHVVKIGASVCYEQSTFTENSFNFDAYDGNAVVPLGRGTLWLYGTHRWSDQVHFFYEAFGQPAFSDLNNYRIHAQLGLDVKLIQNLSLSASYLWNREQLVVEGIQQDDQILTFGLSYSYRSKR